MIPLLQENIWVDYLKQQPLWHYPLRKTVILSPHPDDETLGVGGLITDLRKKNIDVLIIAITDGENAYPDVDNLRQIRIQEQELALQKLGVTKNNIIRLGLKDSAVAQDKDQLRRLLLPYVDTGAHLIAPWVNDFHPDHKITGKVALQLAKQTKMYLSFYFFWTWHYCSFASVKRLPLHIHPLTPHAFKSKQSALECYFSQQTYLKGEPILTNNFLKPAQRRFEAYYPYEH